MVLEIALPTHGGLISTLGQWPIGFSTRTTRAWAGGLFCCTMADRALQKGLSSSCSLSGCSRQSERLHADSLLLWGPQRMGAVVTWLLRRPTSTTASFVGWIFRAPGGMKKAEDVSDRPGLQLAHLAGATGPLELSREFSGQEQQFLPVR